jgi:hypothetical protein
VTRIQLVHAVANYFKHHDEWPQWPTNKRGFGLSRRRDIGAGWNYAKDNTSVYRSDESAVWHGLENDRASPDRAGVASTSNQGVGMRARKSWALELPMAAPDIGRAIVPAAEPLCLLLLLRTPTRFGLSTFKHEKGIVGRSNRACPGFDRNGQRQRQGLALFRGATAIPHQ